MDLSHRVSQAFTDRFGELPQFIVRAPGRVNLIGEHTDYNEGFVMPMAVDRAVWIALRPRSDQCVALNSLDMDETGVFDLDTLQHNQAIWFEYVKGIAWALMEKGYPLTGWEGVMVGDVPIGAGLSSSAAIEMAVARAFMVVSNYEWNPAAMAHIGQLAENHWMGVSSGIMDQMISAAGQEGHALLIDCRSLEMEAVPLPKGTAVIVLDTNTRRGLVDSAYNERQQQCKAAAAHFGVPTLRDVDCGMFQTQGQALDETIFRRARHVITENGRVLQAKDTMQQGDAKVLGKLLNASHTSLRDDYEVSSLALDTIVELAQSHRSCYGARMTGAGFGGCAIALIDANIDNVQDFVLQVSERYQARMGLMPSIFACRVTAGASIVPGR